MSPVRTVGDVGYVAVPATAALAPQLIKLTALEAQWVAFPVLQHIQLFVGDDMPPFDTVLSSLRRSLAETLASFAPLAGKLVHLADTGDVAISCSSSDGVKFVVAEESGADIRRLAGDEEHDVPVFERLAPELDMGELPTAVLAVKATRFKGGVALGVTAHHAVADGRSMWRFMEAWAAACRGETPAPTEAPSFDRSLIKIPGGEELTRSVLRKAAPNLPVARPPWIQDDCASFSRRTFTLDARDIQRLKQRIADIAEAHRHGDEPLPLPLRRPPSTFAAAAALAWASFARCKPLSAEDDVAVFFLADLRGRLDPPVAGEGYFGTCLTACAARLRARELRGGGERALAAAAAAVQGEVRRMEEDPLPAGRWDLAGMARELPPLDRLLNVTWSPRFRPYDVADFGWGKPARTEPVGMNHDGQVALMRAKDGGGVQVSVSLRRPEHMDEFKAQLLKLLG